MIRKETEWQQEDGEANDKEEQAEYVALDRVELHGLQECAAGLADRYDARLDSLALIVEQQDDQW